MNPLTNVRNIKKLNETELRLGITGTASWHNQYKDSAWIFIGGLPYDLSEGDILTVFSQYGEIVNINLIRDRKTGKSKGYCFLCYEDQRSTILAVDNFNGIQVNKRTIRVDHVLNYKIPKEFENEDEITKTLKNEGCAPKETVSSDENDDVVVLKSKRKKVKKEKRKKEKKKKKRRKSSEDSSSEEEKHKIIDEGRNERPEKSSLGREKNVKRKTDDLMRTRKKRCERKDSKSNELKNLKN